MAASRICPNCLAVLVTNPAHTRVWCPRCQRTYTGKVREAQTVPPSTNGVASYSAPVPQSAEPFAGLAVPGDPTWADVSQHSSRLIESHSPEAGKRSRWRGLVLMSALGGLAIVLGAGFVLDLFRTDTSSKDPAEEKQTAARNPADPAPAKALPAASTARNRPAKALVSSALTKEQEALRSVYQQSTAGLKDPERVLAAAGRIDELVQARLTQKGITPSPACSDAVFVRRVYLDVIGRIPTAEEARTFLADTSSGRRAALIDQLLAHRDFADYWTMKWCDILRVKSEFPINLWPNAVQAYHRWIHAALRENRPYDLFARDLLTASGSNFRDPPANFYRAVQKKDAATISRAVALTFMGVRPEGWPKERWAAMEPFFGRIGYKLSSEWKEEIVYFDMNKPFRTSEVVFPDGTKQVIGPDQDPREVFADWLITPENPWFTRNITNRVWSWLVGRGIIHEVDDIRPDNPPSNPELLAYLQEQLVLAKYDLRQLYRVILNSRTYQSSSIPVGDQPEGAALFAYYPVRRLEAEVLIDAICQVTGTTEKYSSPIPEPFTYIPESHRSVALADASITSPFLEIFGRSSRDTGLESERNNTFTPPQRLHMLNSAHIIQKIQTGPAIQQLIRAGGKPKDVVERLYLTILSRYPTQEELSELASYRVGGEDRRAALDLAWALMNTAEFLCRH